MKKPDLKKIALMGITGGVMLTAQQAQGASFNPDELIAARSWTCRNGSCGYNNHKGHDHHNDNNSCSGKSSCGGSNGQENHNGNNSCGGSNGCGGSQSRNQRGPNNYIGYGENVRDNMRNFGEKMEGEAEEFMDDQDENDYYYRDDRNHKNGNNNMMNGEEAHCAGKSSCGGAQNFAPMNEGQFIRQLSVEGRRVYSQLPQEGKQLALRLAKQYADKDQAVKHASRQIR